jgi:hypothetical protein
MSIWEHRGAASSVAQLHRCVATMHS